MLETIKIELEVVDPEVAYRAASGDPRGLGVALRSLLMGKNDGGDRYTLEHDFGVRVASLTTVFKNDK